MYVRLIAKYPDQPSGAHFDYMDVYKVARVTFSGTHLRDRELDDPWYGSQGLQSGRSECAQYQRSDQEEYDLQRAAAIHRMYEQRRYPIPIDRRPRDPCYQHPDTHIAPPPEAETQVHRFREPTREEENHEIEDLMGHMHGLSAHNESYVELYAQCAHRFPNIPQILPKLVFAQHVPAPAPTTIVAFSHHTPVLPPPPARQLQAVTADPPPSVSNHAPSSHIKGSDSGKDHPFCIFAAKKKLKAKRSAMPESRPSPPVFPTPPPSTPLPIVSPTSLPAP